MAANRVDDERGAPLDGHVARLARLFREHPAWRAAARHLDPQATSTVYFTDLAGTGIPPGAWRLEQRDGETRLVRGAAADPELVLRFTPGSIDRLEEVDGGIGDFAVALFSLILDGAVDLRIRATFSRLLRRGYVALLLAAGPAVLAFGAAHGVRTVGALRRLVAGIRSDTPADWEI